MFLSISLYLSPKFLICLLLLMKTAIASLLRCLAVALHGVLPHHPVSLYGTNLTQYSMRSGVNADHARVYFGVIHQTKIRISSFTRSAFMSLGVLCRAMACITCCPSLMLTLYMGLMSIRFSYMESFQKRYSSKYDSV